MVRHCTSTGLLAVAFLIASTASVATAEEKAAITAKDAFKKLKTLEGSWKNTAGGGEHGGHDNKVTYHITGAGSALVETDMPGSNHEMVSVYHLDRDELRMTHYCAAGNQPRLRLDRAASTPERLVFVFDGGSNLDPAKDMHIHGLTVNFVADGKVNCVWDSQSGGKKADSMTFELSREKK